MSWLLTNPTDRGFLALPSPLAPSSPPPSSEIPVGLTAGLPKQLCLVWLPIHGVWVAKVILGRGRALCHHWGLNDWFLPIFYRLKLRLDELALPLRILLFQTFLCFPVFIDKVGYSIPKFIFWHRSSSVIIFKFFLCRKRESVNDCLSHHVTDHGKLVGI